MSIARSAGGLNAVLTIATNMGPIKRISRLRQLAEDAALITGSSHGAANHTTDPTLLVADRKIQDAARRGVFENLPKTQKKDGAHRLHAADAASYLMAKQLAAANVKPRCLELRLEVQAARDALVDAIRRVPRDRRHLSAHLRHQTDELQALVKAQHSAAVADALAFGITGLGLQVPPFDFDVEAARLDDDSYPVTES